MAPKLKTALINKDDNSILELYFDSALETSVPVPLSSFLINYGKYTILSYGYVNNSIITLSVDPVFNSEDDISVTYNPPIDLTLAIRSPVSNPSDMVSLKRAAVKQISSFPVYNLLENSNRQDEWLEESNLAGDDEDSLPNYPIPTRGSTREPTPDDFILMYGEKEAIQISNIDDASATKPNLEKIWMALQDACAYIDNYIHGANHSCFRIVSSNRRRTACIIARYYLDTVRRRQNVTDDFERCIKEISNLCDNFEGPTGDDPLARENGGILRTWRIPQYYNGVTGKGFTGWWVDTCADKEIDYRNDRSQYNAENNNNDPNEPSNGRNVNPYERPSDNGGNQSNP